MSPIKKNSRLFVSTSLININDNIKIEKDDFHYIKNVLRLSVGDEIELFNNTPNDYLGVVTDIKSDYANIAVNKISVSKTKSKIYTTLLQAIPKSDKLELIIQKVTELGIDEIIPIESSHSIKKISTSKLPRLQKIAIEAAKQSKRSQAPTIREPMSLTAFFKNSNLENKSLKILFNQNGENNLKDELCTFSGNKIFFAVGPEGDFSKEEIELFSKNNFKFISLGDRILRAETAAIITTGIIQYETKNLQP